MLVRTVNEMHQYWDRKYTPKVKPTEKCKSCSLRNICLPSLLKTETVDEYLRRRLDD
ncbi:Dna2/Cas4 domain-containing protein [Lactobacillus delbrueckii subsp. lactis]|nr:Dna2/Cas4 domain-containing protein [Lactobacillus delbrueckii]MCD5572560.1 Dna2/Cas4 domain-containing protein [Lactobacillus delbrueckii subsp. lactis]MCD5580300.1 Dna2/Cas4 domain-containing protein [Lactobacillus delbrueckii subsp. lactis]